MVLETPVESVKPLVLVLAIALLSLALLWCRLRVQLARQRGLVDLLQELLLVLDHLRPEELEDFVALRVDAIHLGAIVSLTTIIFDVQVSNLKDVLIVVWVESVQNCILDILSRVGISCNGDHASLEL